MQQLIKRFLWVGLLALGLQGAWAFSPGGPIGNGGDSWQEPTIAYGLGGDENAPKNLGEEYRRNTPVMYYACDANFLDFFGSNGLAAVDGTFAILNNTFTNDPLTGQFLTNGVDGYSPDLTEFPLETRHLNYQAQAMGLRDLKSWALGMMAEQLGLTDPVRYNWTLHDRVHVGAISCPAGMEYLLVERNFDLINSSLNQTPYSPYVNDTLYSYYIQEDCSGDNPLAFTVPFAMDPSDDTYSPVASFMTVGLTYGQFYTGMTRDDVAGLRYLLAADTINYENPPADSLLIITNLSSPQLITTLPLGPFLLQSQTLDPATLEALYPGLIISSTATNYTFVAATNVTAYYTNQPGPAVTNYSSWILWTNYDLATFNAFAQTSGPAALLAAYPNLDILTSTSYPTNIPTPNVVSFLEELIGAPAGSFEIVVETNGFSPNILTYYTYTFGNLLTNSYSPSNKISIVTSWFTNQIGAPYTSPLIFKATTNTYWSKTPSGDFFIVPTNWCGYEVLADLWTNKLAVTNFLPVTSTNGTTTTTNGSTAYILSQYSLWTYTNRIYAVEPGVCEPVLQFATNIAGAIVTNYGETFANIATNSYFPNSLVTIVTTNIGPCPGGLTNILCTNITSVTFLTNTPSGDFWIVPAAWNCGYNILSVPFTNAVATTNTILMATIPPGVADIGQQYSVTLISYYTNHSLLVQPILCSTEAAGPGLREGIEKLQFLRADYDSLVGQYFQPVTNTFTAVLVTNSQTVIQTFQRVVATPDFLFSAADLATGISSKKDVVAIDRNLNFDQTTILAGLAGPGLITPSTTITFDKVGPVYYNYTGLMDGTPYFTETPGIDGNDSYYGFYFTWASYDGTTNAPVVYPDGISIQNLESEVLVQVSPASLPNGTNGVAYPPVTFTASGGAFSPAFTWSANALPSSSSSGLPSGLTLTSGGTLSGTPTQSGEFDFILQMTDSLGRSVQWYYSITIQ
jgi:hypothetical protein